MRFIFLFLLLYSPLFLNQHAKAQEDIPTLNNKIVAYVNSVMGTQVDRGECWDLAAQALNRNNAEWDGMYVYGKEIDPEKDEVFPGDIIQFKNVKVRYVKDMTIYNEEMKHHTAIVYTVIEPGVYEIAHQNTAYTGRKVGVSILDLSTVQKGKLTFYRPIKENS